MQENAFTSFKAIFWSSPRADYELLQSSLVNRKQPNVGHLWCIVVLPTLYVVKSVQLQIVKASWAELRFGAFMRKNFQTYEERSTSISNIFTSLVERM